MPCRRRQRGLELLAAAALLAAASALAMSPRAARAAEPDPGAAAAAAAAPSLGLGLDLSEEDEDAPARIVAVPPRNAAGKPEAELYARLHAALAARLKARLVGREATLAAFKRLPAATQRGPELAAALARAVGAGHAIAFQLEEARLRIAVYGDAEAPAAAATMTLTAPWTGKPGDAAAAAALVAERACDPLDLEPPPGALTTALAVPSAAPAGPPPDGAAAAGAAAGEDGVVADEDLQREGAPPTVLTRSLPPPPRLPFLWVAVGAGPSYRDLATASSPTAVLPRAKGVMTAVALSLSVGPSLFSDSLARSRWGDWALDADARRTFSQQPQVRGATAPTDGCAVDDDETRVQLGWRYPLGRWAPRVGLGVGFSYARVHFTCGAPAVSTAYDGLDLQARVLQPLGSRASLELRAGPRLLLGAGTDGARAWTGELWLSGFPSPRAPVFLRAGLRTNFVHLSSPTILETRERYTVGAVELGLAI